MILLDLLILILSSSLDLLAKKKATYKWEPSFKTSKTLSTIESKRYQIEVFDCEDERVQDGEEDDMSTHFWRVQKTADPFETLKQPLERYVITLPVFGFNSGRYDLNFIKSILTP